MSVEGKAMEQETRYPIGRWTKPAAISSEKRASAVCDLAAMPELLRRAVDGLGDDQLNTPYREGGWTVRQLVHHVADSHMNAYIRVRQGLTEEAPLISVYDEKAWAELPDSAAPVEWSLELLEALHARWVMMLEALNDSQWQRTFVHPERGPQTIEVATQLYAWHARHHVAHIAGLRDAKDW